MSVFIRVKVTRYPVGSLTTRKYCVHILDNPRQVLIDKQRSSIKHALRLID